MRLLRRQWRVGLPKPTGSRKEHSEGLHSRNSKSRTHYILKFIDSSLNAISSLHLRSHLLCPDGRTSLNVRLPRMGCMWDPGTFLGEG